MTCEACALAEKWAGTGRFDNGCNECETRMIANGLRFAAWRARGSKNDSLPRDYRKALDAITRPGETTRQAHERVKAWAARIKG